MSDNQQVLFKPGKVTPEQRELWILEIKERLAKLDREREIEMNKIMETK